MQRSSRPAFSLVLLLSIAMPAAGQPGGETDGIPQGVIYSQGNAPVGETNDTAPGRCFFAPPGGMSQVQYNWWFYRVAGDAVQRPFGTYTKSDGFAISGTSSYPHPPVTTGPTATYNWSELGRNGTRFTAVYTTTVSGVQGSTTQAQLAQTFQINNPNATALDIVLFNEALLTPGGVASGPFQAGGNVNSIDVADGAYHAQFSALGASDYEFVAPSVNFPDLYGTPALDLNNTGLPYAGTATPAAAFEWELTVPANGSVTVSSSFNAFVTVPEPGAFQLSGIGLAAFVLRGLLSMSRNGISSSHAPKWPRRTANGNSSGGGTDRSD